MNKKLADFFKNGEDTDLGNVDEMLLPPFEFNLFFELEISDIFEFLTVESFEFVVRVKLLQDDVFFSATIVKLVVILFEMLSCFEQISPVT